MRDVLGPKVKSKYIEVKTDIPDLEAEKENVDLEAEKGNVDLEVERGNIDLEAGVARHTEIRINIHASLAVLRGDSCI